MARVTSAGVLDPAFGSGGIATISVGTVGIQTAYAAKIQADGKIVVAGTTGHFDNAGLFAVRFTAAGTPDATFGNNGVAWKQFRDIDLDEAYLADVELQADGKLVLAGYGYTNESCSGNNCSFGPAYGLLLRLNADGTLDNSFSGDGVVLIPTATDVKDVEIQDGDKILVSGYRAAAGSEVSRYRSDGTLDSTFDGDGVIATRAAIFGYIYDVEVAPSGDLLVAGATSFVDLTLRVARISFASKTPRYASVAGAIQITDDERIVVSVDPNTISENGGVATGTVRRTNLDVAQPLTVTLTSSDATEATVPVSVTIPGGQQSQTFPVTAVNDAAIDGTQTVTLTGTAAGYISVTATLSVTSDEGFVLAESGGHTTVSETGTNDSFTAVLNVQPASNVVIAVTNGDTTEITVNKTSLTFTSSNWNTPQTVTVTGVDDVIADGDITSKITLSINDAASNDLFDPLPDQIVRVTTLDNDTPAGSPVKIASDTNGGPTLANIDTFGRAVASVGDLDQDGVPDLAVGAGGPGHRCVRRRRVRALPERQRDRPAAAEDQRADGHGLRIVDRGAG